MTATEEPRYQRSPAVTSTVLGEETLCLNLDTGQYTGLKGVAQTVWTQLEMPCTLDELLRVVVSEYDVDHERSRTDLRGFLREMLEADLVRPT